MVESSLWETRLRRKWHIRAFLGSKLEQGLVVMTEAFVLEGMDNIKREHRGYELQE